MQTLEEVQAYWAQKIADGEAFCERMKHLDDPNSVTDPYDMAVHALQRCRRHRDAALSRFFAPTFDAALDQALASDNANGDVFSGEEDISARQVAEAERDEARESLKVANERIAELESREPEVRIVERVVEVSSPEAAPLKIIPDEIAAMMDPGDTFSPEVRRKLTERLNVELAELKNLRGLAGEDLKREAEIEKLLGLFARLGEI